MSQSLRISCTFNPVLSEPRTDALRRPTRRGGSKSKAEPQELCEQRREREISSSSLRSNGLNVHNQLEVPCICGIPEYTTNHPKIEAVDFGSKDIYIFFLFLFFVSVYVYASLCDFVCIALPSPFVLGFCLSCFFCLFFVLGFFFFSIVFSACYHWWICFLVWLLFSFFLFFFFFFYYFKIF